MSTLKEILLSARRDGVAYISVGEATELVPAPRGVQRKDYVEGASVAVVDQGQAVVAGFTDDESAALPFGEYIVFGDHTRSVKWVDFRFAPGADGTKILRAKPQFMAKYLFYAIKSLEVPNRGYSRHWSELKELRVAVPSREAQNEVVGVLDRLTDLTADLQTELRSEAASRASQFLHYRDSLLHPERDAKHPWVRLAEISENLDSLRRPITKAAREHGKYPYYGASGVVDHVSNYILDGDYLLVSEDGANLLARSTPIAFSISGKTWVNNHAHVLAFATETDRRYVEIYLNSLDLRPHITGSAQPKLSKSSLNTIPIPWPTNHERERVVDRLERYGALVKGLREALASEITHQSARYRRLCDNLLAFKEKVT